MIETKWCPLSDCNDESFGRGVVFRFPARYPFEDIVDFMLVEDLAGDAGYSMICATGHHAGHTELRLPGEARHPRGGVSAGWLKTNWEAWIYPDCGIADVLFMPRYPPGY